MMSSVNFYGNYSQQQCAVAFRGKAPNVSDSIKKMLDRRDYVRKHNGAIPADKIIRWFKELKIRISGNGLFKTRKFCKTNTGFMDILQQK